MQYVNFYYSPLGKIVLTAGDVGLTGLWFEDGRYSYLKDRYAEIQSSIFDEAKRWLDIYFSGDVPAFTPKIELEGTPFQLRVWNILKNIPYGSVMSYKEVAQILARQCGVSKMSAQAVGGAIGKNRISIIIPCHRVIASDGALTGYAGGIERKTALLSMENIKI